MEISLNGNFKDVRFPKLLVYLNRNRKTGILTVKTPSFTKRYTSKGDAVFASSTDDDDGWVRPHENGKDYIRAI
jgi:hypothetical protein